MRGGVSDERAGKVFDFIVDTVKIQGYPPTIREIGEHFGWSSPATVSQVLDDLVERGWIRRPNGNRKLRITLTKEDA